MPPKRKRVKHDPDVVKTEPDNRRATGDDDENDDIIDTVEEPALVTVGSLVTAGSSLYRRTKLRKSSNNTEQHFPFMLLPAEVRNMIYRYLVVSNHKGFICIDEPRMFVSGGIEIAIMLVNHQLYDEASQILYDENKCRAWYSSWTTGVALRVDEPKTSSITSRSLRSGRAVDMVKYRGLIYPKSLQRLRHVEFKISLPDRSQMCEHMALYYTNKLQHHLIQLSDILFERLMRPLHTLSHGTEWKIAVDSPGILGHRAMRMGLVPILDGFVGEAVSEGKMKLVLTGKFPATWKRIFRNFEGQNVDTTKLQSFDLTSADVSHGTLGLYFDDDDDDEDDDDLES